MNRPLVIYHGNCADGFTSAWAAWKKLRDGADYFPGVYGQPPPDVKGRMVILLDFSYKRPVLEQLAKDAWAVAVLDHHKTAAGDLTGYAPAEKSYDVLMAMLMNVGTGKINVTFDMEKSGARLAWEWFHPGTPVPMLVQVIEDRDLWRFALKNCREYMASIFSYAYDFKTWDMLDRDFETPDAKHEHWLGGRAIERKHHKDIAELVVAFKRRMVIGGVEVWCANLPYTLTSDAGHLMCEGNEPFAACYWDTPAGRVFSLRSRDDGADVAAIAAKYGGGGHAHASGFTLPYGVEP